MFIRRPRNLFTALLACALLVVAAGAAFAQTPAPSPRPDSPTRAPGTQTQSPTTAPGTQRPAPQTPPGAPAVPGVPNPRSANADWRAFADATSCTDGFAPGHTDDRHATRGSNRSKVSAPGTAAAAANAEHDAPGRDWRQHHHTFPQRRGETRFGK